MKSFLNAPSGGLLTSIWASLLFCLLNIQGLQAQQVIENVTYSTGNYSFTDPNAIISPSTSTKPVVVTNAASVDFSATNSVSLKPGFRAGGFTEVGVFQAYATPVYSTCTTVFPYQESFEHGKGGWTVGGTSNLATNNYFRVVAEGNLSTPWPSGSSTSYVAPEAANGQYMLHSIGISELSRCFNFAGLTNPTIRFKCRASETKYNGVTLIVKVQNSDGSVSTTQQQFAINNSLWSKCELSMPFAAGKQTTLSIKSNLTTPQAVIYIDDVSVVNAKGFGPIVTGNNWFTNEERVITWSSYNIAPNESVKITLLTSPWYTLSASAPNTGNFVVNPVPELNSLSNYSQIRLELVSDPTVMAYSEYFTTSPPTIEVTAPTKGTLLTAGTTATVNWTSQALPNGTGITIDIVDGQGIGHFLAVAPIEAGTKTVTLPNWVNVDGKVKMHVYVSTNVWNGDYSDAFTVAPACASTVTAFPYTEGFESGLGIWSQSVTGDDDFDWTRYTGARPGTYTGPASAKSGNYYVYTNTSAPNNPDKIAFLQSQCINLAALSVPELRFWYNMYGYGMGSLSVQVSTDRGGNWSSAIWTKSGEQGDVWKEAIVSLTAYTGKNVMLRFVGKSAYVHSSYMAVDDIKIAEETHCNSPIATFPYKESFESATTNWVQNTNDDTEWLRNTGPTPGPLTGPDAAQDGGYYMYISQTPLVSIKTAVLTSPCFDLTNLKNPELTFWYHLYGNYMGLLDVQVSTDGGSNWHTTVWSKMGDQGNLWFQAKVDLSPYKGNSVKVRMRGTTQSINGNEMAFDNIEIGTANPCQGNAITSYPYTEDFESGTIGAWVQGVGDDKDWIVKSGGTSQVFTGPDAAQQGTKYLLSDCYDINVRPNLTGFITSPCFDLRTLKSPVLDFWYHKYGEGTPYAARGVLELQISLDGGNQWAALWTGYGNEGNIWKNIVIDLSTYISENSVKFRFVSTAADSERNDMAIDNIKVYGKGLTFTSPIAAAVWSAGQTVNVTWNSIRIGTNETLMIEFFNGTTWSTLSSAIANTGTTTITVPSVPVTVTNAKVRLSLVAEPIVQATSTDITINVAKSISITNPIASSQWTSGSSQSITWTSQGMTGSETLSLEFFNGSSWSTLVSTLANSGTTTVTVPTVASVVTNAAVRLTLISNTAIKATSANFTASPPGDITITSPVASTIWVADNSQTVTWTSVSIALNASLKIEYFNGTSWTVLSAGTPNDGSEAFLIPYVPANVTTAQVRISLVSPSIIKTSSSFKVNSPICSGTSATPTILTATSTKKTVTDGSGSNNYNSGMDCYWKITVPANYYFWYKNNSVIGSGDYLEIPYMGYTCSGTCTATSTQWNGFQVNATATNIIIHFHSDNAATNAAGFSLDYAMTTAGSPPAGRIADELEETISTEVLLYPNPADETVYIESGNATITSVNIYNAMGQLVKSKPFSENIDVSDLAAGVYSVEIHMLTKDAEDVVQHKSIVLN